MMNLYFSLHLPNLVDLQLRGPGAPVLNFVRYFYTAPDMCTSFFFFKPNHCEPNQAFSFDCQSYSIVFKRLQNL